MSLNVGGDACPIQIAWTCYKSTMSSVVYYFHNIFIVKLKDWYKNQNHLHLWHSHVTLNNKGNGMVQNAVRSATELEKYNCFDTENKILVPHSVNFIFLCLAVN